MEHVSKIVSGLTAVIEIKVQGLELAIPNGLRCFPIFSSEDVTFETWCYVKSTG
jgi:hypothetical protein